MNANVIAYADKVANRLGRKYRRMIRMGKPHNVAVTAIARELACYILEIETGMLQFMVCAKFKLDTGAPGV